MKVLIAGGSGLIGSALANSLVANGHEVVILSRSPERVVGIPTGIQLVGWDGRTASGWGSLVEDTDAIVNLAGASIKGEGFLPSRWTSRRKQLIRQSRLDAGHAIAEAVRFAKRKPKVLLQASAVGYYGPRGTERINEEAPPGGDFLANVCIDWEASTAEVEKIGVRRVVARTGLPLTLQGGAFPLLTLPFRLFAGNWFGSGEQYYSWIHFEDYIAALRYLLENPKANGFYNLSAPEPVTNRDFARALGKVMHRPVFMPVPGIAVQLALGEVSTVVLDGQRVIPAHLEADGFAFKFPQLESALHDLLK